MANEATNESQGTEIIKAILPIYQISIYLKYLTNIHS